MDCALAWFIYSCHVVHGSKSAVEFLCLGFPVYCHKWDISMVFVPGAVTKIVKGLGLFWSFCLFVCLFPVLLFFHTACPVFMCRERLLANYEITHSPTLMRSHTSPPGIPEAVYSILPEYDCLVPCQFIISYKYFSGATPNMVWCPIYFVMKWLKESGVYVQFEAFQKFILLYWSVDFFPRQWRWDTMGGLQTKSVNNVEISQALVFSWSYIGRLSYPQARNIL